MRAIKLMQSKEDFKKACEAHVETKLQLTVKKAKYRKEIQKCKRALSTMLKTQQTLALELEENGRVRKQIQMSEYYNPKAATSAPSSNIPTSPNSSPRATVTVKLNKSIAKNVLNKFSLKTGIPFFYPQSSKGSSTHVRHISKPSVPTLSLIHI